MTPTVVVAGAIANKLHNGGEAWVRLSWARAFASLGYAVHLIEELHPSACVDALGRRCLPEASVNVAYFQSISERFGLQGRAHLITASGDRLVGFERHELEALAHDSQLLVNISGHLRHAPLLDRFRRRVYVDLDPGFTQIWHEQGADLGLARHHLFFTVGQNIGRGSCPIPTGGFDWRPIRQPVVPQDWPVTPRLPVARFTTVASWRGPYGPVTHDGVRYGVRAHEMRAFAVLPRLVSECLEVALAIDTADEADRQRLIDHGWHLVEPVDVAGDPFAFRRYLQGSFAELSLAQGVYVRTRSGWFSDRTVRYLASGRPALVQDTGLADHLPTGTGLLTFRTLREAATGIRAIAEDWEHHSHAARQIALAHFTPAAVLGELLAACELGVTVA